MYQAAGVWVFHRFSAESSTTNWAVVLSNNMSFIRNGWRLLLERDLVYDHSDRWPGPIANDLMLWEMGMIDDSAS